MDIFVAWNEATAALPWGAQRALKETLQSVADEQIKLAWGADYNDGTPCLINAASTMLKAVDGEGGHGKPSMAFPNIVSAFDKVNQHLFDKGVNTHHLVSPLAAEILVANFAPLKDEPQRPEQSDVALPISDIPYVEPNDEAIMQDWLDALASEECITEVKTVDEQSRTHQS